LGEKNVQSPEKPRGKNLFKTVQSREAG
jgi:hypothetical protein